MSLLVDAGTIVGLGALMLGLFKFTANKLATKQDVSMCNTYHKQLKEDSVRDDKTAEKIDKRLDDQHKELVNKGNEMVLLTQEVKQHNK